jgi:hypothetical protein
MVFMVESLAPQPANKKTIKIMKRLILCVALSAFACGLLAGESDVQKPASADKPAACCGAAKATCSAKGEARATEKPACCCGCCKNAKSDQAKKAKKVLMSPKAAAEARQ